MDSKILTAKGADSVSSNLQLVSLTRRRPSLKSSRQSFDRFIPTRRGSDHETAHHLLTTPDTSQNDSAFSPEGGAYGGTPKSCTPMKKRVSRVASEDKVLLFSPRAVNTPKTDPISELTRHMSEMDTGGTPKSSHKRFIPKSPDKVFDMPELRDDFYSNVLDWGSRNKIAVAIEDKVFAWNVDNAASQSIYTGADENESTVNIKSLAWDPRGKNLAMGTEIGDVRIWRSEKSELSRISVSGAGGLCSHGGETDAVAWDKTGSTIFTAHNCGCIHEIVPKSGDVTQCMSVERGASGLAVSPDNRYFAIGSNTGAVHIWGVREKKQTCMIRAHVTAMKALAWLPWQQSALASGGGAGDGYIRVWNTCSGTKTSEVNTNSQICAMVVCGEHKELVTGHGVSTFDVIIWSLPRLTAVGRLQYHTARVLHLTLSPDETTLASLSADETLVLWKCFEGTTRRSARKKSSPLPCASPLLFGIR